MYLRPLELPKIDLVLSLVPFHELLHILESIYSLQVRTTPNTNDLIRTVLILVVALSALVATLSIVKKDLLSV